MAWITPKVNWSKTDHFNATDYNRIKGNLEYLATFMSDDYTITITQMGADKSKGQTATASEINLFPQNLYAINNQSYKFVTIENVTYTANQFAPNYAEWNRVESAIFNLYKTHKSKAELIPHLSWTMGGAKAFGKRVGGN